MCCRSGRIASPISGAVERVEHFEELTNSKVLDESLETPFQTGSQGETIIGRADGKSPSFQDRYTIRSSVCMPHLWDYSCCQLWKYEFTPVRGRAKDNIFKSFSSVLLHPSSVLLEAWLLISQQYRATTPMRKYKLKPESIQILKYGRQL